MSPSAHVLKGWSVGGIILGGGRNLEGVVRDSSSLEMGVQEHAFSLVPFSVSLLSRGQYCSTTHSSMMRCLTTGVDMMGKAGFLGKKKSNPSLIKPQACSAATVLVIQLFQIYCIFRIFSESFLGS